MANFVALTLRGKPCFFNADRIAVITRRARADHSTGTVLYFSGIEDDYWPVDETPEQVILAIGEA